jgi:hypothetical protein
MRFQILEFRFQIDGGDGSDRFVIIPNLKSAF